MTGCISSLNTWNFSWLSYTRNWIKELFSGCSVITMPSFILSNDATTEKDNSFLPPHIGKTCLNLWSEPELETGQMAKLSFFSILPVRAPVGPIPEGHAHPTPVCPPQPLFNALFQLYFLCAVNSMCWEVIRVSQGGSRESLTGKHPGRVLQISDPSSVVPGPEASASHANLLEKEIGRYLPYL